MTKPISEDAMQRIKAWLEGPFDPATKDEIKELLTSNPQALEDAFFKDLSFGTGGMRGIMGLGTNRMNIYTVRAATQGLANFLLKNPSITPYRVFIGYDVRHHSKTFAEEAGKVLAGNGIEAFISQEICPTPLVSFACRHFHCQAGIMITASHNPPQYNGYKVYGSDGAQVVPPQDEEIVQEVQLVKTVKTAASSPKIRWIGKELDHAYLTALSKLQIHPELKSQIQILYTNLHGTGLRLVPDALSSWGYTQVSLIQEQSTLDGAFPNAPSPNPEDAKALALGISQLIKEKGDLLLATDPDADRVGLAVCHQGEVFRLTGNQIGCLCLYHIVSSLQDKRMFPSNAAFVKTIVTTELFKRIAEGFGGRCIDVLTGFKYIAEKIRLWENEIESPRYLFGAEESYGYLFGTFVRDKDAISSCCLIAEAAALAKEEGKTLVDRLYDLYRTYGIHRETLISLSFPDTREGLKLAADLMQKLREHPPSQFGNIPVTNIEDYLSGKESLPKSDVLRFWLEDGSKLVIRPSGTEPKIKIYAEVREVSFEPIEEAIQKADAKLNTLTTAFRRHAEIS